MHNNNMYRNSWPLVLDWGDEELFVKSQVCGDGSRIYLVVQSGCCHRKLLFAGAGGHSFQQAACITLSELLPNQRAAA